MNSSTVGFKTSSADLHKKSPRIFLFSLITAIICTFTILIVPFPVHEVNKETITVPPVVITLQNIPETRHIIRSPAPPKPLITPGLPIEVEDEIIPDDITIEDTYLDLDAVPNTPSFVLVPDTGVKTEESEIFEYYAVEEKPQRINNVVPVYPPMAERAKLQGRVTLRVLVNKAGDVDSVHVESGLKIFHESAIEAAKATRFTPAKQNDRPVACWVIIPYTFVFQE
ncbi:MAG: energy transducer TonB [Candidatus Latescibacteria bacterium]|nr:energy transducer TonB [Candidatus Latescibacterota bacterium]